MNKYFVRIRVFYEIYNKCYKGLITVLDAEKLIHKLYKQNNLEECIYMDICMLRKNMLLTSNKFEVSFECLCEMHNYIFNKQTADVRKIDVFREEKILNGKSVRYEKYNNIIEKINHEFECEIKRKYNTNNVNKCVNQISSFISSIWQIHPFNDGNTRVLSAYLESYLKYLGFNINFDLFFSNNTYFRDALVISSSEKNSLFSSKDRYLKIYIEKLINYRDILLNNNELKLKENKIKHL